MSLPPFDPEAVCPKCGRTPVGTRFCNRGEPALAAWALDWEHPPFVFTYGGEHLHRKCGRCDYEWLELTAAGRNLTQEEADRVRELYRERMELYRQRLSETLNPRRR